jgi:hypothetical protein
MTQGRGVLRVEVISWGSNTDAWPWRAFQQSTFLTVSLGQQLLWVLPVDSSVLNDLTHLGPPMRMSSNHRRQIRVLEGCFADVSPLQSRLAVADLSVLPLVASQRLRFPDISGSLLGANL